MVKFLFLSILMALLVVFQNCSSGKNYPIGNSAESAANIKSLADKVTVLPLDLKTTLNIQISNVINTEVRAAQDLSADPDIYYYLINLTDGKIQSFDLNNDNLKKNYCLSANDRAELDSILQTAQLCVPNSETQRGQDDRVCTMNYVMPYAHLHFSQQQSYALGERTSGCDTPTDLCGEHSKLLRGFVRNLLLNIKTKICN